MKYLLIGLALLSSFASKAQTTPSNNVAPVMDLNAPYLKDKHLPAFSLMSVEGKEITNKDLPKNYKYTIIIIFSPDCSHCEHEAAEINKNADKFKNVLFIWDSYRDMELIKKFAAKYSLVGQPNVIIGRDAAFTIPSFFRPRMTPFVALYEKGNFVKVFEQGVEPFELIKITQGN
jgi:thiol-disulfide isomerase/thioredoxin